MAKFDSPISVPKRERVPTYNMTQAQIDAIKQETRRDGMRAGTYAANAMYSVALLLVLRDRLGYGQTRLARIFNAVQKIFDEIASDEVAYKDAAQALRDECHINLIIERPGKTPTDVLDMFYKMELAKAGYRVKLR